MADELTRRELFSGIAKAAFGAAAVAAVGAGSAMAGCSSEQRSAQVSVLEVADDDVVTLESFTEVKKPKKQYSVKDVCKLSAGAMLTTTDKNVVAALCVGKTADPLSTVTLLDLESKQHFQVLDQAVGDDEGYSIFDVACSGSLLLWVESNYLTGDWRVYSASVTRKSKTTEDTEYEDIGPVRPETEETTDEGEDAQDAADKQASTENESGLDYVNPDDYNDEDVVEINGYLYRKKVTKTTKVTFTLGKPLKLDEGDAQYDEPEIAAVGDQAYWIVQPAEGGERTDEDSLLKTAGGSATAVAYTSHGRFNGGLSVSDRTVTCMPRADASGVYYQLTALQGGSVVASQVMPLSYKPGSAIYMGGAFAFSIPASYDYGGGISHVGTYYPMDNGQWLRLTRQPVTPPGLCNGWLFCKSGSRTVFVDMKGQQYFTVDAPGSSANHGDYSVAFGEVDAVCTYASVDKTEDDERKRYVQVRLIEPKSV